MAIIAEAVESLKASVFEALKPSSILATCEEVGHRWRARCLDPVSTIWLFAHQILLGNTACSHVARLRPDRQVTDTAYCQARARLPLILFRRLFERVARCLQAQVQRPTMWRGRRVVIVDGTSCTMPYTKELDAAFGHPAAQGVGCSFPVMSVLGLFEAGTGLMIDLVLERLTRHDASLLHSVIRCLRRGDVVIADRAFAGWCQLMLLVRRGVDVIARLHQCRMVDAPRCRVMSARDWIERWPKPADKPDWMQQGVFDRLPEQLEVRVVEYRVEIPGHRTRDVRLVTTLLDADLYPNEELAERYLDRWEIEVNFRHLKQTLRMDQLKCRTPDGVRKEVYMFGIIYNLVRVTMLEAAQRQGVPPDRISFIDVLRWLVDRFAGHPMPVFKVNPRRPGRFKPRTIKRRPTKYPLQPPGESPRTR